MTDVVAIEVDPFEPGPLDQETELTALAHAVEFADGFSLVFVQCNQTPQRRELMAEVHTRLPKLTIQEIHLSQPVNHLLDAIRERLTSPLPDGVFVSGLEHSLPDLQSAATTPFIANLNASRNSFPRTLPRPLVLWAPEYVLKAIAQGAPDFFSIRSGVYAFAAAPGELAEFTRNLTTEKEWETAGLPLVEKQDRMASIRRLLADYETLPATQRDRRTEIRLLHRLGVLLYSQGEYEEALRHYQLALKLAEELSDRKGMATLLHQIGNLYSRRGDYDAALQQYQQSLAIEEKFGDRAGVAASLHQVGTIHQLRGEYDEALRQYQQSLAIEEKHGNRAGVATSLHQIGTIHQLRGEYDEALRQYQQSLAIWEKLGSRGGLGASLHQIGMIHQLRGEYDAALRQYQQSLAIREEIGDRAGAANSHGQIGLLLADLGQYQEAFDYQISALAAFAKLQSPNASIYRGQCAEDTACSMGGAIFRRRLARSDRLGTARLVAVMLPPTFYRVSSLTPFTLP
ncbi:MAG: tetratricopeptide repeat protein, partial [Blastocatellia bacterium]